MSERTETAGARYEPFQAVRARRMALGLGVAQLVVLATIGVAMGEGWWFAVEMTVVGVLVFLVLWRFATVSAIPDEQGLSVRNIVYTTRLDWPQILAVRFGGGNPWVSLDLADGDSLAVMGIQKADGERAEVEAKRLARLVAGHSPTDRND